MKHLRYYTLVFFCLIIVSCDSNKNKVKDVTTQFVTAVSSKDKVIINEIYPNAKTYSVLQIVDSIKLDNVDVKYYDKDSIYIVKLNKKQSLVFKIKDGNEPVIMDSYGILKLDSAAYDLAAKTSAPVTKQSDLTNGKLFSDEEDFIKYLSEQYPKATNGNLFHANGRYFWKSGYVEFNLPVTNGGNARVKGEDYNVEITFTRRDTGERVGTLVETGISLAPNETFVFNVWKNDLFKTAQSVGLYCYLNFNFKNASVSTMLARYGSFTGKEYDEFVEQQAKTKFSE